MLERTTARATSLDRLDEALALAVSDLAEDDVLAVEPRSDDSGDEELGSIGVGAGIGHGEEEGFGVLELEVLVGELLAIDGLPTGAL